MMSAEYERPTKLYRVHGLVLESELELPELAARPAPIGALVDVHVRLGEVEDPGTTPPPGMRFSAAPDGAAFLKLRGLAGFLVRGGREVTVDAHPNADPAWIRAVLYGWIVALVCVQRDFLVLHASAVAFGDRVIAFMGDPGAGKSTLAAHCVRAGAKLVADDMLRTEMTDEGPPLAHPGMPLLKLLGDTLEQLGRDSAKLPRVRGRANKFNTSFPGGTTETALPIARLCLLEHEPMAGAGDFERMTGAAATMALVANSHGVKSLDVIARRPRHFHDCMRLAGSVEIVRLKRRRNPGDLPKTVAMLRQSLEP